MILLAAARAQQQRDEEVRRAALVEAYWLLRDHEIGLRDTKTYRRAAEQLRSEHTPEARLEYSTHSSYARGVGRAAEMLAVKLLGMPEHEIERPAGTPEVKG